MTNGCGSNKYQEKPLSPDLLVIGAGSAGFSASIVAAEKNFDVVLVGDGIIGGTCVNVGCIPSKVMTRATETLYQAYNASRFSGIEASAEITNWKALIKQKQLLIEELRQIKYINILPNYKNISYIKGKAKFVNEGVTVNGILYTPKKTIITTGSSPLIPTIKGIENIPYLTSTTALELDKLPKSLIIIGGGVIGVELAQIFARAGTKVTICCRNRLIPMNEPELSTALKKCFQEEEISVCEGINYQKVEKINNIIRFTYHANNETQIIETEHLLLATGRIPNTSDMGLKKAGIDLIENGGICVNEYMQTTREDVYAAGDVIGKDMFVYMAAYGAKLAALNIINGNKNQYNNNIMPRVVFTDPQVADVGLTEAQAQEKGYSTKVSTLSLGHVPRFIVARNTKGIIKLVADKQTDKLLGAHILAPEAGDIIQTMTLALKGNFTTTELADTIFPYLTGVEGLKLAAQMFNKDVSKLSCCAG